MYKPWSVILKEQMNKDIDFAPTGTQVEFYIKQPSKEEVDKFIEELNSLEEQVKAKD